MRDRLTFSEYGACLREFIRSYATGDRRGCGDSEENSDMQFNRLALALFARQFESVLIYRRFCESRKANPAAVSHWTEIPTLPISAFKEVDVTSLPPAERTTIFHSSGTTAQKPSRHWHNADSLDLYEASLLAAFQRHLLGDIDERIEGERSGPAGRMGFIILTPASDLAPHSSLVHMLETVRRELGARDSVFTGRLNGTGAWSLDVDQTLFAMRKSICANRPVAMLGTAFSFVHLLDHFAVHNIRYHLAEGSRIMETGGYKGHSRAMPKAGLHALITKHLGVSESHIISEYGMSELSSQAYDGRVANHESPITNHETNERVFQFPPWTRAQIISPETSQPVGDGETGLIRIFDLANVRSVMALQTEDLGLRRGDGFELLGRAIQAEPRGCSLMLA